MVEGIIMPFKNQNDYNEYMKEYMREYRARKKKKRDHVRMAKKLGLYPKFTYEVI